MCKVILDDKEQINFFINRHKEIILFADRVEKLFVYIALSQLLSNTLNTCCVGYLIVMVNNLYKVFRSSTVEVWGNRCSSAEIRRGCKLNHGTLLMTLVLSTVILFYSYILKYCIEPSETLLGICLYGADLAFRIFIFPLGIEFCILSRSCDFTTPLNLVASSIWFLLCSNLCKICIAVDTH